jgi:hypothetical protein
MHAHAHGRAVILCCRAACCCDPVQHVASAISLGSSWAGHCTTAPDMQGSLTVADVCCKGFQSLAGISFRDRTVAWRGGRCTLVVVAAAQLASRHLPCTCWARPFKESQLVSKALCEHGDWGWEARGAASRLCCGCVNSRLLAAPSSWLADMQAALKALEQQPAVLSGTPSFVLTCRQHIAAGAVGQFCGCQASRHVALPGATRGIITVPVGNCSGLVSSASSFRTAFQCRSVFVRCRARPNSAWPQARTSMPLDRRSGMCEAFTMRECSSSPA